jgi:hypothetical protein
MFVCHLLRICHLDALSVSFELQCFSFLGGTFFSESVKMNIHIRNFQFTGGTLVADKLQSLVFGGSPLHTSWPFCTHVNTVVLLGGYLF